MEVRKTREFDHWLSSLKDLRAKGSIIARLRKIELHGALCGDRKAIGNGLVELRFDKGPGYRVHVVEKGDRLLVLLAGGDKSTQARDIEKAKKLAAEWEDQA